MIKYLNRFYLVVITGIFASLLACDDILEEDIATDSVVLLAPVDSMVTDSFSITFWWEELEGASDYLLQVVSPSFESPFQLLVDTVIATNKFTYTFAPGNYQWRVKGQNFGFGTDFSSRTFVIDSSGNLSSQPLKLIAPENGFITNDTIIKFSWESIPIAEEYLFEIITPPAFFQITTETSIEVTFDKADAREEWRVTAFNENSITRSDIFEFTIDVTSPEKPSPVNPENEAIFNSLPIGLTWNSPADDRDRDSLFVYVGDQNTLLNGFPVATTNTTFTFSSNDPDPLDIGIYFWAVKTVDRAGNVSDFSEMRKFELQ